MARIFLSHSSEDNAPAIALRDWLASEGWDDVFLDLQPERGIVAGERWERALHDAMQGCAAIVFLASPRWLASTWCLKEYRLADKLGKRMFGCLLDGLDLAGLPEDISRDWQLVDLTSGRDHIVLRAVWPGWVREEHVTLSQSGLASLRTGLARAGLDPKFFAWPPTDDPQRAPYRGLRALEQEDAGIFFGREAPTIALLDQLRGLREISAPRFLAILGASGAGKSSFLRAGLLPRLARDEQRFLPLPVVRPERAALSGDTGLVAALTSACAAAGLRTTRAEMRAAVQAGSEALLPLLASLAEAKRQPELLGGLTQAPPTLVLSIDQGEELFQADGANEAHALLDLTKALAKAESPAFFVLVTIRTDAYERLQAAPELADIAQQTFSLPPMPRGAYVNVIEGPARRRSERAPLAIEPALTQALLADIEHGGSKDALPLLSFTLERLFLDHGADGDLTRAEYEQTGGIRGSIEAAVERALKAADTDPRVPRDREVRLALLRRALIPWLAGIDAQTGKPRRHVARLAEIPDEARPLVEHLVDARLLATDTNEAGAATVEPAHEALLRQWGTLEKWLEEDTAALSALDGVKRAARDWGANARDENWLDHHAGRLEDAEGFAARDDLVAYLTTDERAYLAACRTAEITRKDRELAEARRYAAAQKQIARRTRMGLAAAMALAVLAGGAAWYGFDRAREAETQRGKAQANFAAAKQAVDGLTFDIAQGLRNVEGMRTEIVMRILDRVRGVVDRLARAEPDNPDLQRSRKTMLDEIGDTLVARGEGEAARKVFEEALQIAEALAFRDTSNAQWQRDLSISHEKIGNGLIAKGDSAGALVAYRKDLAIVEMLSRRDPTNMRLQHDLSIANDKIGDGLAAQGDHVAALIANRKSLAIRETLAAKAPENAQWQRDLAISHDNIGNRLFARNDGNGALAAYRKSLEIREALTARDPANTQWQRDLLISHEQIGGHLGLMGDYAGSNASYGKSLAVAETLTKRDPANTDWQRDLGRSYSHIGESLAKQRDDAGSLIAFRKSLAIREALAARDPANTEWQRDHSIGLDRVGEHLANQGDLSGALPMFRKSLAIREALAARDPANTYWQLDLARTRERVGRASADNGNNDEAVRSFERAREIYRELLLRNPQNAQAKFFSTVPLLQLGMLKGADGREELAEALSVFTDLAAADQLDAEQRGWILQLRSAIAALDAMKSRQ